MSVAKKRPYVAIRMDKNTLIELKILSAKREVTLQRMLHAMVDRLLEEAKASALRPVEAISPLVNP